LSLAICIHGEHGTGKSWLASTAPAYRLVLDSEGGSRFAPGAKCYWKPATGEAPPTPGQGRATPNGEVQELDWHTCIVQVTDSNDMQQALTWLESGKHPFRSVIVDSLTEMQKRIIDRVAGTNQPTYQDWGEILRVTEDLVRRLRDLMWNPRLPLECIVIIAMTHKRDNKYRPFVKGQLELTLPGLVDVVGYLYNSVSTDGVIVRNLLIAPLGDFDAKDRTDLLTKTFGSTIVEPNLEVMNTIINS